MGSVLVVDRSSFGDVGEERVGLNGYYSYYVVNAGDCVGFVGGDDDGECYRHCRCCPRVQVFVVVVGLGGGVVLALLVVAISLCGSSIFPHPVQC